MNTAQQAIGVFDSGIGGLSVLQALRAELPRERFVYLADTANAPYGERSTAFVAERSHAIAAHLIAQHQIKALVVACNTATAAVIHEIRANYLQLPLIGIEPALKPAVALRRTGRIGVMGTRGTLGSAKFGRLLASLAGQAQFVLQACDGLAHAIERSSAPGLSGSEAATEVRALSARYISAMGRFGTEIGDIDTLVLGCTHYVFAESALREVLGAGVQLIATGEPVARQTRRLLQAAGALAPDTGEAIAPLLLTTGPLAQLQTAAARWLQLPEACCHTAQINSQISLYPFKYVR